MKKILVTLDFPPERGGIQRYLHDIVTHTFTPEDLVLTIAESSADDALYPCRIIRVYNPFSFFGKKMAVMPLFLTLMMLCLRERSHVTLVAGNVYSAFVARAVSIISSAHYSVYSYGTELMPLMHTFSLRSLFLRHLLRHATTIYYLTTVTRLLLERSIGVHTYEQCTPKIDRPEFSLQEKQSVAGVINLLSVGRLVPHKGHRILIEAMAIIECPAFVHLTIVGDGPEHALLVNYINQRHLEQQITIKTECQDSELITLYKKSDLFILPSIVTAQAMEGFGIVLLEAMAYGCAIIASHSGGIPEVFASAPECVLLVPPGDAKALAAAITTLANDHSRRAAMTGSARQLLGNRYAW